MNESVCEPVELRSMQESVCESGEPGGMQESVCESEEPGNRQESVWESGETGDMQGSVCDSGESAKVLSLRALRARAGGNNVSAQWWPSFGTIWNQLGTISATRLRPTCSSMNGKRD